jgi:hypothetical protein
MLKLFNKIIDNDLSPNGLYLLYCIKDRSKPKHLNEIYELRILVADGFLNDDYEITEKGEIAIEKIESHYEIKDETKIVKKTGLSAKDIANINKYRELFPKGNLPSGSPARISIKELEKKFLWFLSTYKYSWDVILKATKKYIDQYETEGYKYMKTSGYFIVKNGLDRTSASTLATYCDMILDGDVDVQTGPSYAGAI